ncbi:hypothetical protein P692DRAFT_20822875 [Suillus brevipes Sb2]|nr:hypothetical protein P692DRAFT_20822875 [Suillus brevipes Sb2]
MADRSRSRVERSSGVGKRHAADKYWKPVTELLGAEDPAPPTSNILRPPEGGRYLTPQRAELMEEALWLNMETTKKKREWRDRFVAERRAKRLRAEVSGLPMGREPYHRAPTTQPAGPSTYHRTPTPGSSTSSSSSTSAPNAARDGHAMDVEDDGRANKDKHADHDPSKKPKKK